MATTRRLMPSRGTAANLPAPMIKLQNRWYNCLADALSLDPAMFQIVQPAAPMVPADDSLWIYLDAIPPASLTFNRAILNADRLFDEYASMVSQIEFPQTAFAQNIGEQNYQAWSAYLATQGPPPADSQLPSLFQNWAARNAPEVASAGVAFLSRQVLVNAARQALAPYRGPNAKPAEFIGTYTDLLNALSASPRSRVFFDSSITSANVLGTWTGGVDAGVDGLWAGSGSGFRLSRKFAASKVTVGAKFHAYAHWTATPGPWYSSSLLNIAYSNPTTPPWRADANPTWSDLFGPDGTMRRFVASLVVVDGGNITVSSDAIFSATDQQAILDHAPLGVWPFYAPTSRAVSNAVTFSITRGMEIEIVTQPGNPIVIGSNVLGVARYLGHADG